MEEDKEEEDKDKIREIFFNQIKNLTLRKTPLRRDEDVVKGKIVRTLRFCDRCNLVTKFKHGLCIRCYESDLDEKVAK